jgi:hypothetical protein
MLKEQRLEQLMQNTERLEVPYYLLFFLWFTPTIHEWITTTNMLSKKAAGKTPGNQG